MESDILDSLDDLGYEGALSTEGALKEAVEGGPSSVEFTRCVEWLTTELTFCAGLTEHVNAINGPDDAEGFVLELSGFLREYGCPLSVLVTGPVNERLAARSDRLLLLDFLLSELQACHVTAVNRPELNRRLGDLSLQPMETNQSEVSPMMKRIMMTLGIPKPPADVSMALLFQKISSALEQRLGEVPVAQVGVALLGSTLSPAQWSELSLVFAALRQDYETRRRMLLNRLDVTIDSFSWSDRLKHRENELASSYGECRRRMQHDSQIDAAHVLAARDDLLCVVKASGETARQWTRTAVNQVIMGAVPDRGGRPYELDRPLPDMPSFQKRQGGGVGRGGAHHEPGPSAQRDGGWSGGKRRSGRGGRDSFWESKRGCR